MKQIKILTTTLFLTISNIQIVNQIQTSLQTNNSVVTELLIKNINYEVSNFEFDNKNNMYFFSNEKLYKIIDDTNYAQEIFGFNGKIFNHELIFDSINNVYFIAHNKIYKLENNSTVAHFINISGYFGDITFIIIDNQNNIIFETQQDKNRFKIYKFDNSTNKTNEIKIKINGIESFALNFKIDKNDNIIIVTSIEAEFKVFIFYKDTNTVVPITNFGSGFFSGWIVTDNKNNMYWISNEKLWNVKHDTKRAELFKFDDVPPTPKPVPPKPEPKSTVNIAVLILIFSGSCCILFGVGFSIYFIYYKVKKK